MIRSPARVLFVLLLVAYGYFWAPRGPGAQSRMAHVVSIVAHGTNTIDRYRNITPDWSVRDGRYYSNKAPGMALLCVPVYLPLYHVERWIGRDPLDSDSELWWSNQMLVNGAVNGPITALGALALLAVLMRLGAPEPRATLAAVAYGLATPVLPFTTSLHSHGMVAAFLAFALYFLLVRPRLEVAGLFCGLATLSEYVAVVPTVLIAAWVAVERRSWRDVARFCAGGLPMLAIYAAYHAVCFGNPLTTAYAFQDPSGMRPGGEGLSGFLEVPGVGRPLQMLFGPHRGLFFHCPLLLLAVPGLAMLWRRGERRLAALSAAVPLGFLAVTGFWLMWAGGTTIGPRFLIPSIPFLMLGVSEAMGRWPRAALGLAAVSFANAFAMAAVQLLVLQSVASPMTAVVWPQFARGVLDHDSLGKRLGLPGLLSLVPLLAIGGVLAHRLRKMVRPKSPQSSVLSPQSGPP